MNTLTPFPKNKHAFRKKMRESRSKVRKSLHEQRQRLITLRLGMKEGRDLVDDMDACTGEIDLLLKELQSIEDGGHTTFLKVKRSIAPKKNISSGKAKLKEETNELRKRVKALEEKLFLPNLTTEQRDGIVRDVSEKKERLVDLRNELYALTQYNHTRFVDSRDEDRKNIELEEKLRNLDVRNEEVQTKMLTALEQADDSLINSLYEELDSLDEEKRKLLEPDGDPFLQPEDTDGDS
ncbi:MAG: hypothetical protein HN531_04850 [Opitutae bacterium]|jgi:hypothetical protein|nr:hypothetical protein [Opitutae bacterium]